MENFYNDSNALFNPFDNSAAVFDSGSGFTRDSVFTPESVDSAYKNDDSILDAGSGFDSSAPQNINQNGTENRGSMPRRNSDFYTSAPQNINQNDTENRGSMPRRNSDFYTSATRNGRERNIIPDDISADAVEKPDWHSDKIAEDSRADGFALNDEWDSETAEPSLSGISISDEPGAKIQTAAPNAKVQTDESDSKSNLNGNYKTQTDKTSEKSPSNTTSENQTDAPNAKVQTDESDSKSNLNGNYKTQTDKTSEKSPLNATSENQTDVPNSKVQTGKISEKSPFAALSPNSWTVPDGAFDGVLKNAEYSNAGAFLNSRDFEAATLDIDTEKELNGSDLNPDGYDAVIENSDETALSETYDPTAAKPTKTETHDPTAARTKTVFIIGASDGIGAETAALFLEKGYSVYNASRTPSELPGIKNLIADAANPVSLDAAVAEVLAAENKIDIFIYSAGFSLSAPFENTTEEDCRYLFDVNFFGFARAVRLLIPPMRRAGGGKIIAISSMGGIFPIAFDAFYSASKAALNMLVRSIALEVEPYGIKVTAILPGGTATNFTRKRKIYPPRATGVYERRMMKAHAALSDTEQSGMSAAKVAKTVAAAAESENPPQKDAVGIVNKALSAADKILPENITNIFIKKKYHL
ncbi:MAG: SDR family NAD(P)-dependent oxidoreductase [Clostridiales bacterium]|jgi:short-subunit dehydrogenase|nr:SDR family NAD(P)-dependent oxidoreductase [Clostridiales bacterium]